MTKVVVIGDAGEDRYIFGHVKRLSPEAPVPVVSDATFEEKPGMARNVAANLASLLNQEIPVVRGELSIKTRVIDARSKQHLIRLDEDAKSDPCTIEQVVVHLDADAIVISDYDKGFVTAEFVGKLRALYSGPIFIDTKKKDLSVFDGCFVKVNEEEFESRHSITREMIVTLGERGTEYRNFKHVVASFPAHKVEVVDVCGCGDTFLAALVFKYLETKDIEKSIPFANAAAAVTVQHLGTFAPTVEQVQDLLKS